MRTGVRAKVQNKRWIRRVVVLTCITGLISSTPSNASGTPRSTGDRLPTRDVSAWQARSGGVAAKGFAEVSDASGDIAYCQADVVAGSGSFADGVINLGATTSCPVDPRTEPAWTVGLADMEWYVDTDGDGGIEYVALLYSDAGILRGGVVYVDNGAQTVTCAETTVTSGQARFSASFPSSCIGAPSSFRYAVAATWDENPSGDTCTCPTDFAPAFGVFGSSVSGSTAPVGPPSPPPPATPPPPPPRTPSKRQGYWMIGRTGDTYAFGAAQHFGNPTFPADVVDLEPSASGNGYRTVDRQGHVLSHGDAGAPLGAPPVLRPFETITAISSTRTGGGYWLFSSLGRVFPFGDAPFFGDMAATKLNGPVLDSIPTASGNGYYMVASDGGIFTFGDARFLGSMGAVKLNAPVQSLVPDDDGSGYWLVASDGGIFAFDAEFYGSMGDVKLNKPVTGMVGFGKGYLMVAEDGGIFTFGDAPFFGSLGDNPPRQPIVSTAVLNK